MSLKVDLPQLLRTFDALTALTTVIRPDHLDQNDDATADHVVFEVRDADDFDDLAGSASELTAANIVIRCRSMNAADAEALAQAVRVNGTNPGTGLDGYSGTAGSGAVQHCQRSSYDSGFLDDDDGHPDGLYEHTAVYEAWYVPPI